MDRAFIFSKIVNTDVFPLFGRKKVVMRLRINPDLQKKIHKYLIFGSKFYLMSPFMMEKIPPTIRDQILPFQLVSVSVTDWPKVSANLGFDIGSKPKQWFRSYTRTICSHVTSCHDLLELVLLRKLSSFSCIPYQLASQNYCI